MALIVQKYGGSSVGTVERIECVADKIIQTKKDGHQVVVVVSAMYGETDRLIRLAHAISPHPEPREYDSLLATGEQASIALLGIALNNKACPALSLTGGQIAIITDHLHTKASILEINTQRIQQALSEDKVVIVAGFQGVTQSGDITTLGRGGSDTTAVAIAHALHANECQIYTDVDGVYTTDPHLIPEAHLLPYIAFEDMLEMSRGGAKVLQMHAVDLASQYQMPVRVLSTFKAGNGTLVTFKNQIKQQRQLSGIACHNETALLELTCDTDIKALEKTIAEKLNDAHIEINIQPSHAGDLILTFSRRDYAKTWSIVESMVNELKGIAIKTNIKVTTLSLVGFGLSDQGHAIMHTISSLLTNIQTHAYLITPAPHKVSVVINENDLEQSMRALHATFFDFQDAPCLIEQN